MITYRLNCSSGHDFEGWFKDSGAFDDQSRSGILQCPLCGDAKVEKAIMAPAVLKGGKANSVPALAPPVEPPVDLQKVRQFMAGYRKFVEEHAEYVGPRFPEEARKIHYGETEERHIYGESTLTEARELLEEGIQVAPLPPEPSDLN